VGHYESHKNIAAAGASVVARRLGALQPGNAGRHARIKGDVDATISGPLASDACGQEVEIST
jgi:hypothetical protein